MLFWFGERVVVNGRFALVVPEITEGLAPKVIVGSPLIVMTTSLVEGVQDAVLVVQRSV